MASRPIGFPGLFRASGGPRAADSGHMFIPHLTQSNTLYNDPHNASSVSVIDSGDDNVEFGDLDGLKDALARSGSALCQVSVMLYICFEFLRKTRDSSKEHSDFGRGNDATIAYCLGNGICIEYDLDVAVTEQGLSCIQLFGVASPGTSALWFTAHSKLEDSGHYDDSGTSTSRPHSHVTFSAAVRLLTREAQVSDNPTYITTSRTFSEVQMNATRTNLIIMLMAILVKAEAHKMH
ncbi:hypothetical protein EDD18DRAFT_1104562 [Armillaria luteobubalina]|uniref:Uncharacterized protein n=1 Tax=Armillaria luteobubalina TaxID=153913 RepID=A0AA39Q7M9_9AGAR|nr:hypothetical protein EDD18DRAFT_1104562 [Armillaria luteobubalina]